MDFLQLQLATDANIPLIMQYITQAQQHLKTQGIDQWQDGYPNADSIRLDISRKTGFLAVVQNEPIGYLSIDLEGEPAYENLVDGTWTTKEPYAVVHRLTIGDAYKDKGFASAIFAAVDAYCKKLSIDYLRIDTANENYKMQHILAKNEFSYCGKVYYGESERIAFEKTLI